MAIEIYFRTCRHCGESTQDTNLMKYSTRHYIHPKCAIEKWGKDIVSQFPLWMIEDIPYKPLQDAGLLDFVRRYCIAQHMKGSPHEENPRTAG